MQKGRFIVIEGGDGAGKGTQIDLLRKELGEETIVYTREPGGTPLGKVLRDILLHESQGSVALSTEMFLFLADRAQHAHEVIEPALLAGKNVISDRSWISTIAYQVCGRNRFDMKPLVESAVELIYKECPLDLAVILDIPPEVGMTRLKAAGKKLDMMESMSREARERIQKSFIDTAKELSSAVVIDASRSIEEVYADVRKIVFKTLQLP